MVSEKKISFSIISPGELILLQKTKTIFKEPSLNV